MSVQRLGMVIRVKREFWDAYEAAHADPWPAIIAALEERNIRTYSIFRHEDLLFSYIEYTGDDFDADMSKPHLGTEGWGDEMRAMQEPLETRGEGEWWASMKEVFHFEPSTPGD